MSRSRPRTYHRGNVKEDLITAAERILDGETLEAITVRRLAGEIGVTPGNFYNHFTNLDELLAYVAGNKMRAMSAQVEAARARHRKPLLRIKAAARTFVRFAFEAPQAHRLMFGQRVAALSKYPVFFDAAEDAFERLVAELYGPGIYDRHDPKASHARCPHAYALFAMLNGLAYDVIDRLATLDTVDEIDDFVETMIDSLLLGRAHADLGDRIS
jgi:AcrR family transcriptional regulator